MLKGATTFRLVDTAVVAADALGPKNVLGVAMPSRYSADTSEGDAAALARNLGMKVVAEGVETAEQLSQLRHLGCHYGQGYFLARPAPALQPASTQPSSPECWPRPSARRPPTCRGCLST